MNASQKKVKSRGLIITIIAVAGVVGYVAGIFLPGQKTMARQRKELREKQQFISNATMNNALSASLDEQVKSAHQHVDRWRKHSSSESVGATLFGEIAALATE